MNSLRPEKVLRALVTSLILIAAALLFCGCGSGGGSAPGATPTPTPASSRTIPVVGLSFGNPITVASGSSVTWVNQSAVTHSVVWDAFSPTASPAPGSNIAAFAGGTTSAVWVAPRVAATTEYDYHCGIHGLMMSGKITVTP